MSDNIQPIMDAALAGRELENGVYLLPPGYSVEDRSEGFPRPKRWRGLQDVISVESLRDYVTRYRSEGVVFRHFQTGNIQAVLNAGTDHETPGWGDHVCKLTLRHSTEIAPWVAINGKWLSQTQFIEFVEDNATTVHQPEPASLIDLTSNLSGVKSTKFQLGTRLSTGDRTLVWAEETQTGRVKVPETVMLRAPIYQGGDWDYLSVFLRMKVEDGAVRFCFVLKQWDLIKAAACAQISAQVRDLFPGDLHLDV